MSKYEEEFIGIGTYISLVSIFGLMALVFYILDRRRKKRFIQEVTKNNEMSKEQAETLYKIKGNRSLLEPRERGVGRHFRRLDAFYGRNFHADDFFQLHRWIKCLKEAKREGRLEDYTDRLIIQAVFSVLPVPLLLLSCCFSNLAPFIRLLICSKIATATATATAIAIENTEYRWKIECISSNYRQLIKSVYGSCPCSRKRFCLSTIVNTTDF